MAEPRLYRIWRGIYGWRALCRSCLWSQRSYPTWAIACDAVAQHHQHWTRKEAAHAQPPF